jgi:hypothetical protein
MRPERVGSAHRMGGFDAAAAWQVAMTHTTGRHDRRVIRVVEVTHPMGSRRTGRRT